jgi:hypothetical protein
MTRSVYHPEAQTGFHPAAKVDKLIPARDVPQFAAPVRIIFVEV